MQTFNRYYDTYKFHCTGTVGFTGLTSSQGHDIVIVGALMLIGQASFATTGAVQPPTVTPFLPEQPYPSDKLASTLTESAYSDTQILPHISKCLCFISADPYFPKLFAQLASFV